jgi:hypothetical protein
LETVKAAPSGAAFFCARGSWKGAQIRLRCPNVVASDTWN